MYRKSKPINLKKNLHSFKYLFHVLFSQSITNSARNVSPPFLKYCESFGDVNQLSIVT